MDLQPTAWFGSPFDIAAADETGTATFFLPGVARIGAVIDGRPGFATVTVRPQRVATIDVAPSRRPLRSEAASSSRQLRKLQTAIPEAT